MATITEVEVPVEVTNNSGSEQSESKENSSSFSKLRKRFKKDKDNSKRPSDAKWRQQQIPACRPVFSAKHVAFGFTVIGLVFLALGILFTVILMELREISVDYTECAPTDSEILRFFNTCDQYTRCKRDCSKSKNSNCLKFVNESSMNSLGINETCRSLPLCTCQINITLSRPLRKSVYGKYGVHVYYGISNFYQNHRRYLNSLDLQQIHGDFLKIPSDDCRPLIRPDGQDTPPYLPCGLIANSWFNDSIVEIQDVATAGAPVYDIDGSNIAWDTDRTTRFNDSSANPPVLSPDEISTPLNWPVGILNVTGGLNNENLIVWFRVSAFPWFRKLYGRVKQNGSFVDMPASNYTITITYSYPVTDFNGGKSVILAEVSWLGGRNLFLGTAYIIVSVFLILAAIVLLIIHLTCSKWKENDHNFLKRSF